MSVGAQKTAGLYERLVGEGWRGLDGHVRLLHERARGVGVFDRPDTPWVARLTFVRE